jgi:HlyD family secretion protein
MAIEQEASPGVSGAAARGVRSEPPPPSAPRRPPFVRLAVLALVLVLAALLAVFLLRPRPVDLIHLHASGRLDGYETDVAAKTPGRLLSVSVQEGDRVRTGQVLARLDDSSLREQLRSERARARSAGHAADQAANVLRVLQSQIEGARAGLGEASENSTGQIAVADANVASARAAVGEAQAELELARAALALARTKERRSAFLRASGDVSQQNYDDAAEQLRTASATVAARVAALSVAQRQVAAAQSAQAVAGSTRYAPQERQSDLEALQRQYDGARAQEAAARADAASARATAAQVEATLTDLVVRSPIDGIVQARVVEPGAVIGTGRSIVTLIDLRRVYLRAFVAEGDIGRVRVGERAQVYLDSAPSAPLPGRVASIDAEASFTPESVYFQKDRVQQVFGVRVLLDDPRGDAKPGMPADAVIDTGQ